MSNNLTLGVAATTLRVYVRKNFVGIGIRGSMSEAAWVAAGTGATPVEKRVLVVDGNLLTREGVAEILRKRGLVAATAEAGSDALAATAAAFEPDVALVNASTVALAEVMAAVPCAVVAFGVGSSPEEVTRCIRLQPAGFLLESEPLTRLFDLIDTARADDPQCPAAVVPMLLRLVAGGVPAAATTARALTSREQQILALLRDGYANKEIGVQLGITTRTVKNHLHNVFDKLAVHSRGEAVARTRTQLRD